MENTGSKHTVMTGCWHGEGVGPVWTVACGQQQHPWCSVNTDPRLVLQTYQIRALSPSYMLSRSRATATGPLLSVVVRFPGDPHLGVSFRNIVENNHLGRREGDRDGVLVKNSEFLASAVHLFLERGAGYLQII